LVKKENENDAGLPCCSWSDCCVFSWESVWKRYGCM
jgi:hypothetical protein